MRRWIPLLVMAVLALPATAARRVTVAELRQLLVVNRASGHGDSNVAEEIATLELSERLTAPTLARIRAELKPGPKTGLVLQLLVDSSSICDAPAAEWPAMNPPDAAASQSLMTAALDFAAVTMRHLPNFLATRTTLSYSDEHVVEKHNRGRLTAGLHLSETIVNEVTYRGGHEVALRPEQVSRAASAPGSLSSGLTSIGEFGPILSTILTDSTNGSVTWSHWEQTPAGLAAVFHYLVPKQISHYGVNFCCVTAEFGDVPPNSFHGTPAYHGSLSLDPATGAVLRITLESDLQPDDPITRSAISVQYGSVDIGGKSYICPLQSVAISSAHQQAWGEESAETILRINDVTYTQYHRFGATVKLMPGMPPG